MLVNTTVSHVSPLLSYVPGSAWYEGTLQNDPMLLSYPNASYHATNATNPENANATVSVSFSYWGGGLWVYGGYRTTLGPYKVTLDGVSTAHDGYTGGSEAFAYQLFGAPGLPLGKHDVRIISASTDPSRPILDLDYLIFESNVGSSSVVEHSSDLCVWTPHTAGAWAVDAVSHSTTLGSGAMGMNFTVRTGIAVYGELDAHSAPFSVSVDDATTHPLAPNTALVPLRNTTTLLYVKTGLLQGNHTVWVANDPVSLNATATRLSISSVVVFSDEVSTNGRDSGNDPPNNTSMSPHSTTIFAAAFGALGAVLLAILLWRLTLLYRRRTQRQADVVTARPFLTPTAPSSGSSNSSTSRLWPESPPASATLATFREKAEYRGGPGRTTIASLSFGLERYGLLQPLRRPQSQGTSAPGYSAAATAPASPEEPWSPEVDQAPPARIRTRSTEKRPRRLLVGSPVPSSLPSARILPRGRSEVVAEAFVDAQMPPPYHFLDLH